MSTHFLDLSAALDARLDAMVGKPPIAWENKKYEPVNGTLYIRPTNLQGETVAMTERDKTVGIYQVDIFSPSGAGKNEALVMSDLIADQFKPGTLMTYNSKTVEAQKASRAVISNDDNGWVHIMIEIEYYSYTARR